MKTDLVQYQNANQSFESTVENFIVRKNEFERVMDDIRSTDITSSFQHYVFVGRRGSGKSTLLRRIQAEIHLDKILRSKFDVVNLGEEQSFIYRFYDLWDYVIRELNTMGYNIQRLDFRDYKDDMKAYTKDLHSQIIKALKSSNRRLVLLLDNIDRILDSRSGNTDSGLFRELLINFSEIRIIGGSTIMSEHFWKYDKPLYQFFTVKKLEALSITEVGQLLTHWSKLKQIPEINNIIKAHPGKIQSIRMLTDGMPRTMLLFVDMMLNRPEQNGYQYLQQIVDKATPIYQERLGILSDAQKKVLSELAFLWEAAYVEDLVPKCNMEGKVISSLLNQLVGIRYVEKIKTKNKNNLYRVEERFFNLWFNMTQGGLNSRAKAKALTDFLEKWYERSELENLCLELSIEMNKEEANNDYIEAMSHALLGSKKIGSNYKNTLLSHLNHRGFLKGDPEIENTEVERNILEAYKNEDYEKVILLLKSSKITEGQKYLELGYAYKNLNDLINAEKYYLKAIEKGNNMAYNNLAVLYSICGKESEAEKYFQLAISGGDANAINNLAVLYTKQGKEKEAEKYYKLAIKKEIRDALHNLAKLYTIQGKLTEAEKYYLLAIEKREANALNNLAVLYDNQGKAKEAEKYYFNAIEKGEVDALFNLGVLYDNQGKEVEAEKYYLLAIEEGEVDAIFNLGVLYDNQGKEEEAEKYYLLAIEKGEVDALFNLGVLYDLKNDGNSAEKYYLMAIDKGNVNAYLNLAILYDNQGKEALAEEYYLKAIKQGDTKAFNNLAVLYTAQGKNEEAEEYYKLAVKNENLDAIYNLALFYGNQEKEEKAEEFYLKAIEKGHLTAQYNLALLYSNQGRVAEAEKHYLSAIKNGNINALNNLLLMYYLQKRKLDSLELISSQSQDGIEKLVNLNFEFACILFLYIEEFSKFSDLSEKYIRGEKEVSSLLIERLLIHKQYNWVFKYFVKNPSAIDLYTPLYYSTLLILGDKDQEILKMPPEIKENVDNILDNIKRQQEFYME